MSRMVMFCLCLLLLPAALAAKEPTAPESAAVKELSGMSIVGNDEAPKSLYIVPWKSSELGVEAELAPRQEEARPVDREVFLRQLAYYRVRAEATINP